MGRVLAGMAAVLALLSLPLGAGAQGLHVGAYPPGAGPDAPRIGAYPAPLGTDPVSPPPGQVTSPSRQDETKDYCKGATPDCSVKNPDFHDL
ncbi:MAG TPA: hypothetical protein VEU47_12865 [Candidatus Cybelea sp.]|nr:hypothetical protein [Candidatus Cybelea sp.]